MKLIPYAYWKNRNPEFHQIARDIETKYNHAALKQP